MDFATLLICYMLVFITGTAAYYFRSSTVVCICSSTFTDYIWPILPQDCQDILLTSFSYLLHERNHFYQGVYCLLTCLAHVVLVVDVLPYLYAVDSLTNHTLLPLMFLVASTISFGLCCYTDPGYIERNNLKQYRTAYRYDDVVYRSTGYCEECRMNRPPRSRHCVMCKRCILRYDHHCVWTNSCIGANNHRYFLAFLLTVIVSGTNAVLMSAHMLMDITDRYHLMHVKYIDKYDIERHMTYWSLTQYFFNQYPRVVLLTVSVTVTVLVLAGLLLFHLYLVCINKTSYERYKLMVMGRTGHCVYNKSLWRNIKEVLLSQSHTSKKMKH